MAYHSKYSGAEVDALLDKIKDDEVGSIDSSLSTTSENPVKNKVITEELNKKVDKVEGKQLSTEDFTSELKTKLDGLTNYDDTKVKGDLEVLKGTVDGKQDVIPDLETIRSGASKGSTAIQEHQDISHLLPKSDFETYATKTDSQLTELDSKLNIAKNTGYFDDKIINQRAVSKKIDDLSIAIGVSEITLTADDFSDMIWDGSKIIKSNVNYNSFIIRVPSSVKVSYSATYLSSQALFNEAPILNKSYTAQEFSSNNIIPEGYSYLLINIELSKYDGTPLVITIDNNGLRKELSDNIEKVETFDKRITDTENAVEDIKVIAGSPENTINLTSADFSGLVYSGTTFSKSSTSYNSFILPLYAGVTTQIINNTELSFAGAGHVTTFTFSSAPAIGKMEYVRKGSVDFSLSSFEPLDNEKYICINVNLSIYSDNNFSFKTGSYGLVKRVDNLESLTGKTILCLGDSITENKDNNGKSYSDYLAEELNAKVINIGVGGANLRQRSSNRVNPENFTSTSQAYLYLDVLPMAQSLATGDWGNAEAAANYIAANSSDDNREIVARAKSVDLQKVDIVTIFAGTNDFSANNLVWGEDDSTNPLSIKGAVNLIVESLLSANPRLKIVFFTPIVRYLNSIAPENWSDVFEVTSEYRPEAVTKNYFLYDIETKIQEACRHNHIPCCAWYWTLGWNKINFMQYFVAPDGTHPKNGYDYIGKKMATFLKSNL